MARKEKDIHYLYKTTCLITNRYYIGMHSTSNLEDGYMGSGKKLTYSIRKYGKENHFKEILEFFDTREELTKRETEVVNSDLIKEVNCMNLVIGGGGFMLDDYHYKCSKAGGNIHKQKMLDDPEYKGIVIETLRNNMKKAHRNGKIKYDTFTGKKHSEETKQKMSDSSKGMHTGEKNSQYGTCWVTKDNMNKKIKKENLDDYLNDGWSKGRKI